MKIRGLPTYLGLLNPDWSPEGRDWDWLAADWSRRHPDKPLSVAEMRAAVRAYQRRHAINTMPEVPIMATEQRRGRYTRPPAIISTELAHCRIDGEVHERCCACGSPWPAVGTPVCSTPIKPPSVFAPYAIDWYEDPYCCGCGVALSTIYPTNTGGAHPSPHR